MPWVILGIHVFDPLYKVDERSRAKKIAPADSLGIIGFKKSRGFRARSPRIKSPEFLLCSDYISP
jgi:hypothetical protein